MSARRLGVLIHALPPEAALWRYQEQDEQLSRNTPRTDAELVSQKPTQPKKPTSDPKEIESFFTHFVAG